MKNRISTLIKTASEGICSSYFIRKNNLYYQPYAEDYYYEINSTDEAKQIIEANSGVTPRCPTT